MATDGVKIIDGDTAHDTYWGIMDLFDSQVDISKIIETFPISTEGCTDDFENEIYITSAGLAYWEIGLMNEISLNTIKEVLDKKEGIKVWSQSDEKQGKARERVLNRFWKKINKKNTKVRKPKKYRMVKNFHFQEDEVLIYKLKNGNYCALICCEIQQYRGNCNYMLVPTTYTDKKNPNLDDILKKEIYGREIGSGYKKEVTKQQQEGIEKIWDYLGGNNNFFFGVDKIGFSHKDLFELKNEITSIGKIKLIKGLKNTGSLGYGSDSEDIEKIFEDIHNFRKSERSRKYPIEILIERP